MSLRNAAGDFPIGVALTEVHFQDSAYTRTAALEFNSLVAENECKWGAIMRNKGNYTFGPCDRLADFAEANGMEFRFHTLAWFDYNPSWVFETPLDEREEIFTDYVRTAMR
jgi:endo-1,4-beta-xylanase